jgi:hypothetical protein
MPPKEYVEDEVAGPITRRKDQGGSRLAQVIGFASASLRAGALDSSLTSMHCLKYFKETFLVLQHQPHLNEITYIATSQN